MKVYYNNEDKTLSFVEIQGDVQLRSVGACNQVILSTWVMDTVSMMSNQEVNHLTHILESGTCMYLNSSELGLGGLEPNFVEVLSVNLIKDLSCLKLGAALIIFQIKDTGLL